MLILLYLIIHHIMMYLLFFNVTYVNPNDYFKPIQLKPQYIILGALDSYPKDVVINVDKIKITQPK